MPRPRDEAALAARLEKMSKRHTDAPSSGVRKIRQPVINLKGIAGYKRVIPKGQPRPEQPYKNLTAVRDALRGLNPALMEQDRNIWPCCACRGKGEIKKVLSKEGELLITSYSPCPDCKGSAIGSRPQTRRYFEDRMKEHRLNVDIWEKTRALSVAARKKLSTEELADILEWYGVPMELESR